MPKGSVIFKDRSKLSPRYIPERLPHREEQIQNLLSLYKDTLQELETHFLQTTQIIGGVGTGKTCTALTFGKRLEKEASERKIKMKYVYVNGKVEGATRYILYKKILEKAAPVIASRSLSPEDMLSQLLRYLKDKNEYLFLTVDEIDYLVKKKEQVVYDLTRLNEMNVGQTNRIIGVFFIARDISFHNHLEPSERSSLGRGILHFPMYVPKQIADIMRERISLAFRPNGIQEDVVTFISDLTAKPPINGDIRVALDLLLYSGNLAENLASETVEIEHARKVYGETSPAITTEDILNLNNVSKIILLAMVRSLQVQKKLYVNLAEIREGYKIVCEEKKISSKSDIEKTIQDLIDRGIVDMKSLTEFGISGASAKDLECFLEGLLQRMGES